MALFILKLEFFYVIILFIILKLKMKINLKEIKQYAVCKIAAWLFIGHTIYRDQLHKGNDARKSKVQQIF